MGVRVIDLRKSVQPIAAKFKERGFSMVDLISAGMLFLDDRDPNFVSELILLINNYSGSDVEAGKLVAAAEAAVSGKKQTRRPRKAKSR